MKRSSVLVATLVGILFTGCDAGASHLGSLPEGEPVELEPGYVISPPLPKWRPPSVVPRCGRIELRTSMSPAIEILSSGGIGGGGTGNVKIWEDGTVMFDGAGCPRGSRRRGRMSPARVRAVIDKLEDAHFFVWSCDEAVPCDDSFITSLTVRRGGAENTVFDSGCDSESTFAAQAINLVMQAVGKNACSSVQSTPPSTPVVPPASVDLLTRLRRIRSVVITSDAQDAEHWRLAERVANERLLVGLRKEEIERKLGAGAACDSPWPCGEGFRSEDWYYDIGRLPEHYVGGVPVLFVDFDEAGICIGSRVMHTQ